MTSRRDLFLDIADAVLDHVLPTPDLVIYDDAGDGLPSAGLAVRSLDELATWARHLGAGIETVASPSGTQYVVHASVLDGCPVTVMFIGGAA